MSNVWALRLDQELWESSPLQDGLFNEEIVDHVQHMECEEMDVELIESDDDDVDMEPSKMTLLSV